MSNQTNAFLFGGALGIIIGFTACFFLIYKKVDAAVLNAEAKAREVTEKIDGRFKEIEGSVKVEMQKLNGRIDKVAVKVEEGISKLDNLKMPDFMKK